MIKSDPDQSHHSRAVAHRETLLQSTVGRHFDLERSFAEPAAPHLRTLSRNAGHVEAGGKIQETDLEGGTSATCEDGRQEISREYREGCWILREISFLGSRRAATDHCGFAATFILWLVSL